MYFVVYAERYENNAGRVLWGCEGFCGVCLSVCVCVYIIGTFEKYFIRYGSAGCGSSRLCKVDSLVSYSKSQITRLSGNIFATLKINARGSVCVCVCVCVCVLVL